MLLVFVSFSAIALDIDINKKNKNHIDSILLQVGEWRDIGPFRGGRSTTATGLTGKYSKLIANLSVATTQPVT